MSDPAVKTGDDDPTNVGGNDPVSPGGDDPAPKGDDDVNQRLLDESKKNKDRYQAEKKRADELQAQIDKIDQKKKVEQGKFKDLYESEKSKREELENRVMKKTITAAIASEASKAGCELDAERLLALGNMEFVQFDPESGSVLGADTFVEDLKKSVPQLFSKPQTPTINPSVPRAKAPTPQGPLNGSQIAKLSPQEKSAAWEQAFKKAYPDRYGG